MGQDWTPQKLDVSVDMPTEIDLSNLRAKGLQLGEVELPEEASGSAKPKGNCPTQVLIDRIVASIALKWRDVI